MRKGIGNRKQWTGGGGRRAAIAIALVFAFLGLVAGGLMLALKATEDRESLMRAAPREEVTP